MSIFDVMFNFEQQFLQKLFNNPCSIVIYLSVDWQSAGARSDLQ